MHEYCQDFEISDVLVFEFLQTIMVDNIQIESIPFISNGFSNEFVSKLNKYLDSVNDNVPISVTLHDFFSVCPTLNLIDQFGNYCGVPNEDVCRSCLKSNAFNDTRYEANEIVEWRLPFNILFARATQINYFTELSRQIIVRAFPEIEQWKLIKINPSLKRFSISDSKSNWDENSFQKYMSRKTPHLLFFGGINYSKGSGVLSAIAKLAKKDKDKITFSLLGKLDREIPINVFNHGPYLRENLPEILNRILPDIVFIPSITPETYCHSADEILDLGFRLIAFSHTAVFERFHDHPNFFPISHSSDMRMVYEQIAKILDSLEAMPDQGHSPMRGSYPE
jgi:hypothetical protein